MPQVPQGGQMGQGIPLMGGGLGGMGGGLGGLGGVQIEALFRSIVNHPSFAQIKQLIRNDPSSLALIL